MNTHTRTVKYRTPAGENTVYTYTFDVETDQNIEVPIAIGASEMEITVSIVRTNVRGMCIACTKTAGQDSEKFAELTVKTNSTTVPGDTFIITATNGLAWDLGDPAAIPLAADVTKIYVSNTGTAIAELSVRLGLDSTP